jgi:tRNA threonylcarbamoyl adenosine modification protein YjeE
MEALVVRKDDLDRTAEYILTHLQSGDIVTLTGPLAAGKTTIVKHLVEKMGYVGRVTSPTFVLEQRYQVKWRGVSEIIHLDFYRLEKDEILSFDWRDHAGSPGSVTFVEWPERAGTTLPKSSKTIRLEIIDEQTRRLTFSDNFSH